MSDNGGRPAARAYHSPPARSDSAVSGARLSTSPSASVNPVPVDGERARLGIAKTILLTPPDEENDAASTSRIATPSTMPIADTAETARIRTPLAMPVPALPVTDTASTARIPTSRPIPISDIASTSRIPTPQAMAVVDTAVIDTAETTRIPTPQATPALDPQWYRSGNTVPPPSLRPPAESITPAPIRKAPNPRVVKIVSGIFGGCLLIVAVAGLKVIYQRRHAPVAPSAVEEPVVQAVPSIAPDPANAAPSGPEGAKPSPALEAVVPGSAAATPSPSAQSPPRNAPHASTSPARVTPKPATRRAPVPKKTGRH